MQKTIQTDNRYQLIAQRKLLFLFLSFTLFLCPLKVLAVTNLWTSAKVWSGTNMTALTGGVQFGTSSAAYTNERYEFVGDDFVSFFSGTSSSESDFTSMSTYLFMLSISNTYPIQYVGGEAMLTNTIAISGPIGTGAIFYCVSLSKFSDRAGAGMGVMSNDFIMKHNGQITPLFLLDGEEGSEFSHQIYTSSLQTIVFGVPFTMEARITSQISQNGTLFFDDGLVWQRYFFHLDYIWAQDAQGKKLTNNLSFTRTSEGGKPYPQGPRIFLDNHTATNMSVFWHSIANQPYQLQSSSNLLGNQWSNIGNITSGSGNTNFGNIPIVDMRQRFYRLNLP